MVKIYESVLFLGNQSGLLIKRSIDVTLASRVTLTRVLP